MVPHLLGAGLHLLRHGLQAAPLFKAHVSDNAKKPRAARTKYLIIDLSKVNGMLQDHTQASVLKEKHFERHNFGRL